MAPEVQRDPLLDLSGKKVLVTGASDGLGKATARLLAQAGAQLCVVSRRRDAIEEAAREIREATGARVWAVAADIATKDGIAQIEEQIRANGHDVDVLVVSGGGPKAAKFEDLSDADWQDAVNLLLLSVVRLVRIVLPGMKRSRQGAIAVILSSGVKQPIPDLVLSNALRAGVVGLLQSLAQELAPYNIRVNGVVPGRIETERVRSLDRLRAERTGLSVEDVRSRSQAAIPLGRYGRPEELAAAILFLVSPMASYVTGAILEVDGGMVQTLL